MDFLIQFFSPSSLRARDDHKSRYFQQLHALLNAGVGLSFALSSLGEQAPTASLRRASRDMSQEIAAGSSWTESMRKYPGLFSVMTIALVEAAEAAGFLEKACLMLARDAERDYLIHQTIKKETWYSKLLFFISLLLPIPIKVGTGAMSFILWPPHQIIFTGVVWLLWVAANYFWPIGARGGQGRYWLDDRRLKLPIAGKIVRGFAVAKFCRYLGMSYAAGLSFPRGVSLGAAACGNVVIAQKLQATTRALEKGETVVSALVASGELPGNVVPLLHSGEASGDFDTQLQTAARFLETDAETALHQTMVALSMLIFLLVAIKIGTMVIQFHLKISFLS
jgi:type IV pilus assembly protein PilC